jgi:RNA polymerase sigma-B factor
MLKFKKYNINIKNRGDNTMNANNIIEYKIKEPILIKKVSKEQINRELFIQWKNGCNEAKKKLIELNLGLAQDIANKYNGKTNDYEDILQIAYLALINAVNRFDLNKNNNFSTFAFYTIRGEIFNHFRDYSSIRKKRTSNYLFKKIQDYQFNFYSLNGIYPTINQIAVFLEVDEKEISGTINENQPLYYFSDMSISDNNIDKEVNLEDIISDNKDDYEVSLLKETVRSLLSEEENLIFTYSNDGFGKREIAVILGVSEGKIRKEIKKITKKLSLAMTLNGLLH